MEKTILLPNISNWVKRRTISTHFFDNLSENQLELIKKFVKRNRNYYICQTEEKNNIILCKKEIT